MELSGLTLMGVTGRAASIVLELDGKHRNVRLETDRDVACILDDSDRVIGISECIRLIHRSIGSDVISVATQDESSVLIIQLSGGLRIELTCYSSEYDTVLISDSSSISTTEF